MDACKKCPHYRLYCKGQYPTEIKEIIEKWPINWVTGVMPFEEKLGEWCLEECEGFIKKLLPVNTLWKIIDRLNDGERGFEVKENGLKFYFKY